MAVDDGLAALERILRGVESRDSGADQVAVLAADWAKFFEQFGQAEEPPLFREIAQVERRRAAAAQDAPAVQKESLVAQLAKVPASRRIGVLSKHAQHEAAKVLGLSDPAAIAPQQPLRDLGLDSLMAVQLRNRLSDAIGQPLPATLIFECPTVKALAEYLLGMVAERIAAIDKKDSGPGAADAAVAAAAEETDELAARLVARLDQIGQRLQ
jgi:acyl carrier protein